MSSPLDDPSNKKLFNHFLLSHAPLINLHLKKLKNEGKIPEGIDPNDLHMEGFYGLVDALHKYNPELGASFSTYAAHRIRGKMLDHLASIDPVGKTARTRVKNINQMLAKPAAAPKPEGGSSGQEG